MAAKKALLDAQPHPLPADSGFMKPLLMGFVMETRLSWSLKQSNSHASLPTEPVETVKEPTGCLRTSCGALLPS